MHRPLYDLIEGYSKDPLDRLHMPGHGGSLYPHDITEIDGADSLYECTGILRDCEQRTARLYGAGASLWSAGGSTLCIQAMLAQMRAEGRVIVASRSVHRAFVNACVLLDLEVVWVFPKEGGLLDGVYDPEEFREALVTLCKQGKRACVYLTSPNYLGICQDLKAFSRLCRTYDCPLLVDNAHGAHLAFFQGHTHPMEIGADYCCDSAHKTLPTLTGGSILHARTPEMHDALKSHMTLFGSTSPSYLILESIEYAVDYIEQHRREILALEQGMKEIRQELGRHYTESGVRLVGDDPLHLTITCDGIALAEQLKARGTLCEYADHARVVLLVSLLYGERERERLYERLVTLDPHPPKLEPLMPRRVEQVITLREGSFASHEWVELSQAEGRVLGTLSIPCPPCVPLCMPGERLTADWLVLYRYYLGNQARLCVIC